MSVGIGNGVCDGDGELEGDELGREEWVVAGAGVVSGTGVRLVVLRDAALDPGRRVGDGRLARVCCAGRWAAAVEDGTPVAGG